MAITPKTLAIAGGATGGIGAVGAGIYVATKEETKKIKDLIGSHAITSLDEFEKRFETKGEDVAPQGVTDKTKLKGWCEDHYKTIVTQEIIDNKELINSIKKWCTPTIKQKLEGRTLLTEGTGGNDNAEDWKIKAKNLKDYGEFWEEKDLNLDSIKEVKGQMVDSSSAASNNTWHKLRDWCKAKYKDNFEGDDNNFWKLVEKFCTKATIKDALYKSELSKENVDTEWDSKVTAAKANKSASSNPGTKDDVLRTNLEVTETNKKRETLQKWCSDQYSKLHNEKVKGETETTILSEVKKWCVVLIKEKLDNNKKFTNFNGSETNEDGEWTKKVTALNGHQNTAPEKLTETLKTIKGISGNENENNKRTKLKAWCKDAYEKGYRGEKDNLFLLTKKFCTKEAT